MKTVQEPKQRTMKIEVEAKTTSGLPLVCVMVVDGKRRDFYWVSLSDESDDMQKVVYWRKETQNGKYEPAYRVVVGGVNVNKAVTCGCEWSQKRPDAKPCRHRAGTEKLIQLGKL